ncbi:MAG: aldehyde dehydrogenase [Bacteroidota bacterium]
MKYSALEIETIYLAQQQFFKSGVTRSYAFRKAQLAVLKAAIHRNESKLLDALQKDLGKSAFESYATEIGLVYSEITYVIKHLRQWMQPKRVPTPLILFPSSSKVYYEPLGTVLIISPWNYPFNLLIMPLVAAIAGGNTIILKPSELATETEIIINTIIGETFEQEYIATVNGTGKLVSNMIETHHFDHIFFTGSTMVGKKIMEAAAKQLSPVTLELGGKSPCIVDKDANLDFAARRIAWGKWINAGQTCVAPDYLLVHASVKDKLVQKISAATNKMFGSNPQQSPDFPRIINDKRWETVAGYLEEGNIVFGGESDRNDRYIAPTIIENFTADSKLMQEEIFGPVLPVITFQEKEEVLDWVNKNPYPLACYVYTSSKNTAAFYRDQIRFGGGAINNSLQHLGVPGLPFGGVGYSGMNSYHGKTGFLTFSHQKSMLHTPTWFDTPLLYAPFKDHVKWLRKMLR